MRPFSRRCFLPLFAVTLAASALATGCADVLDIPHYRPAPAAASGGQSGAGSPSSGGAGTSSSGGVAGSVAGEAGSAGLAPPCGLERPLWSFEDGMLHGFHIAVSPEGEGTAISNPALGALVIDIPFDPVTSDGQDAYVESSFALMDFSGRTATACLRLLDPPDDPPPLPQIELFVTTGPSYTNAYSYPVPVAPDGSWFAVTLDIDGPARTDGDRPADAADVRGAGLKIFTLGAGYGRVRLALDAIAIE